MKVRELIDCLEKIEDEEAEIQIIDDKKYILNENGNSIDEVVEITEHDDEGTIYSVYIITK